MSLNDASTRKGFGTGYPIYDYMAGTVWVGAGRQDLLLFSHDIHGIWVGTERYGDGI